VDFRFIRIRYKYEVRNMTWRLYVDEAGNVSAADSDDVSAAWAVTRVVFPLPWERAQG